MSRKNDKPVTDDPLKEARDKAIEPTIEAKLSQSLKDSMLFFVFDQICASIAEEEGSNDELTFHKQFFNQWKSFVNSSMIKEDLEMVQEQLSTDQNIFMNLLSDNDKIIESTEIYQEKYYEILSKIELLFFENFKDIE